MVMNVTRQVIVVLVLGAWAAALAQAEARPRGGKHPVSAAGHVGAHRPGGTATGRGNASPAAPAPVRNAIGVPTQPAAVGANGAAKGTSAAVKPSAIDTHIRTSVTPPSVAAGASKIGSTTNPAYAVRAAPSVLPAHPGGINGTAMARPGSIPGTIGGPAKVAGGISGTGMKQKK
jgi:hypothetical protein